MMAAAFLTLWLKVCSLVCDLQVGLCVAAMVSCGLAAGFRSGQVVCLLCWLLVKHCANILLYR